jgi:ATP-dependent DNA helicase RecQ
MTSQLDATYYLQQMLGNNAKFRVGQQESIDRIVKKERVLLVQKTGWGKSIVYFIGAKMLRDQGHGTTILISPLLSLMRNQIENARLLDIDVRTINSSNSDDWEEVFSALKKNIVDILIISPEQLANRDRFERIQNSLTSIGFFVVDEAHCISDWGHDFRPDYRRIVNIVKNLPPNVPVLATTATANNRVVEDIKTQLGNINVYQGELLRESLKIQVIELKNKAERMAWLRDNVPSIKGSGIIYCLTVRDTRRIAEWLHASGIDAHAYNADMDTDERIDLEQRFQKNKIKCLVATVALGMGYDKPDISFVIHYQRPGSIVSYYQQIGRAGRNLEEANIILLSGEEDDEIVEYFISSAFPSPEEIDIVLDKIEESLVGLTRSKILATVNISSTRLEKCLKYLEVENLISKDSNSRYYRTLVPKTDNEKRNMTVTKQRYDELRRMQDFVETKECYMRFIGQELNDIHARDCGKCTNCIGKNYFPNSADHKSVIEAQDFITKSVIEINPRKKMYLDFKQSIIPQHLIVENGLALAYYNDPGWGKIIHHDKYTAESFRDDLVVASAEKIRSHILKGNKDFIVTYVPSIRRPNLVKDFATKLAKELDIPFMELIIKVSDTVPQKTLQNSHLQCRNAFDGFKIDRQVPNIKIILVDDIKDSGWTFTVCGYMLLEEGANKVFPFALAVAGG